jgi:hypothetical protein
LARWLFFRHARFANGGFVGGGAPPSDGGSSAGSDDGSTLPGLADLTRATGTYWKDIQDAADEREKNRQEKLKTARELLEFSKWQQNFLREWHEEDIEKTIKREKERARKDPPLTEKVLGTSLNWILADLKEHESRPIDYPSTKIEQDWLDNVNFESTGGNVGLLRQKELSWPVVLQSDRFAGSRERVQTLLARGREDALEGKVSARTIEPLLEQLKHLDEGASAEARRGGLLGRPDQHIAVNRFLADLRRSVLLLQNPEEAAFLLKHKPRSKTVAELVQYMRTNGLTFGPASAGSERHYLSLHDAFAQEARNLAKNSGSSMFPAR